MSPKSSIVRASDFKSTQVKVEGKNWTSSIEFSQIELLEMNETHWSLSVPEKSCAVQHSVVLKLSIIHPLGSTESDLETVITGKIESIQAASEAKSAHDYILVKIVQNDPKTYGECLNYFETKQAQVLKLFYSLKGHEE